MTSAHPFQNSPGFLARVRRLVPFIGLGLTCVVLPLTVRAATASRVVGLRLLQAQLPTGVYLRRINCERLARADHAATLAHRPQAVEILSAALLVGEWDERRHAWEKFSCACVLRLFLASVSAAPDEAVRLLDTAEALYPECADDLAAGLRNYRSGYGRDGSAHGGQGGPGLSSADGANADGGGGDGFGAGLGQGAGFPGSPGFGGSPPSGGVALPAPVPTEVTPAVNG